jgi:hypothetical protein
MFSRLSYSRSPSNRRNVSGRPQYTTTCISPSRLGIVDVGSTTIAILAVLASCIFILTMYSAFFGVDEAESYVQKMLDAIAQSEPGVRLVRLLPRIFNTYASHLGCSIWRKRRGRCRGPRHNYSLVRHCLRRDLGPSRLCRYT